MQEARTWAGMLLVHEAQQQQFDAPVSRLSHQPLDAAAVVLVSHFLPPRRECVHHLRARQVQPSAAHMALAYRVQARGWCGLYLRDW